MSPDTGQWTQPIYLDASALVKLLVPEEESEALNQALAGLTDVIVSDLALTEVASALGRRTRERRITRAQAQRLYREASKLREACHQAELTPPIHRRAERLMLSLPIPLRVLDALSPGDRARCRGRNRRDVRPASSGSRQFPGGSSSNRRFPEGARRAISRRS